VEKEGGRGWQWVATSGKYYPEVPNVPALEVRRAHVLEDPFPASCVSLAGVSYRTVERILAAFVGEKDLVRVVVFSSSKDEMDAGAANEYRCAGRASWYPGIFGGLWVTPTAVAKAKPIRERGLQCRPPHVWWEISPEQWAEVCAGRRDLSHKLWKWPLGDAVMEWFREGDTPTIVTPKLGRARWKRGQEHLRRVVAKVEAGVADVVRKRGR